jgi:hypothetical protein
MDTADLRTITARRKVLAKQMAELEGKRAGLEAEVEELAITERVLERLDLSPRENDPHHSPHYAAQEPVHQRALGMVRAMLPPRLGPKRS